MSYIKKDDYADDLARQKSLTGYLDQMIKFLTIKNPTASAQDIDAFVKKIMREKMISPTVEAMVHPREGYSEHITLPLVTYIDKHIASNNLSPSGSCYYPVSKKESFLRQSIQAKVKARNDFKKLYLSFEAQGLKRESQYYNQNQANAKIFNNAIAGGMNIKQFILGSKAGFNAITSMGRLCVKQGYSYIERAVNGNIYLPSLDDAITYVLNHARNVPQDFKDLIDKDILNIPLVKDVGDYLLTSLKDYVLRPDLTELMEIISGLTTVERAYVFYAGSLSNLFRFNETVMSAWIDSCFLPEDLDPELYKDIDIDDVKTIRHDVVSCMLSVDYRRLGRKPDNEKKWNSIKDAAKNNPEGLKAFIYCCHHFVKQFETMIFVLRPIMRIEVTFSKLIFQNKMARYTVPLSDTDSNIFSTQELIRWKRKKLDFSREAYEMNAITTFIISQCFEHVFARLSSEFGVEGGDVFTINMKNEFLYPVLMATSLAKHYLAEATMQEGAFLPTPRKDYKGVGFRSSAYPKIIKDGFEEYVSFLIKEITKAEPIKAVDVLNHVASIEATVVKSLKERESNYLPTVSIKRREEYADPNVSVYFYYELWHAVFEEEFGEMPVPNKCFKVPLKYGKKLFKDPFFMEELKINHPGIHGRLVTFMELNPKRDITYILIPPFKGKFHPFFLEVMDARVNISQMMAGYYHLLNTLGIGTVDGRANGLVSDFIDPTQELIN